MKKKLFVSLLIVSMLSSMVFDHLFWRNFLVANVEAQSEPKYNITFHANGGEGYMESTELANGDAIPVSLMQKDGYHFTGWARSQDAQSPEFADGGAYFATEDLTLYAVWSNQAHAVHFDANGASSQLQTIYLDEGESVYLPSAEENFHYDGASFDGWSLSYDGLAVYRDRGRFTMGGEDTTLYAQWRLIKNSGGSSLPQYANTSQWSQGIVPLSEDEYILTDWGTKLAMWKPDYGFYDTFQSIYNLCWAAAGSNMMHYWTAQNRENIEYLDENREYPYEFKSSQNPYDSAIFTEVISTFGHTNGGAGASPNLMISWYLEGVEKYLGGAWFKDVFENTSVFTRFSNDARGLNEAVKKMINEGGSIEIIYTNHAFSVWGASFDENGYVNGLYFTNSNDQPDLTSLSYKPIYYMNGYAHVLDLNGEYQKLNHFYHVGLGKDAWEKKLHDANINKPEPQVKSYTKQATNQVTVSTTEELKNAVKTEGNQIVLNHDLTVNETIVIDQSISIDLNGHFLKGYRGGSILQIGKNAKKERIQHDSFEMREVEPATDDVQVVLKNSNPSTGGLKDGNGRVLHAGGIDVFGNNTVLKLENVTIENNQGKHGGIYIYGNQATVTMDGGKIINNSAAASGFGRGGAVYVEKGSFVLNSGEISGNTSDFLGGAIAVNANAKFVMNGGTITNNKVIQTRGNIIGGGGAVGVLNTDAYLEFSGGTIIGNSIEGKNVFGGGILDKNSKIKIKGPITILGNSDENLTYESNLVLDTTYEKNRLEEVKFDDSVSEAKIGIQYRNEGVGNFMPNTKGSKKAIKAAASYFKSDITAYEVNASGELVANHNATKIEINHPSFVVDYGDSTQVELLPMVNGEEKLNGQLILEFENGKTIKGTKKGNKILATISPISDNLGFKIGKNKVKAIYKEGSITIESEFDIKLAPKLIHNGEIVWRNVEGRVEGDGKAVEATIQESAILPQDRGKVSVFVEHSRNQEPGNYKAVVNAVSGERSDYYMLVANTPIACWQKEYTVSPSTSNVFKLIANPQEQMISPNSELTIDVQIKRGDASVSGGVVNLEAEDGYVLAHAKVSDSGNATIRYQDVGYLQAGANELKITYHSNARTTSEKASAPVSVVISNTEQETLTYNGTLSATGEYGITYNELKIKAEDLPIDSSGNKINGEWRWRVKDLGAKPEVTDTTAYEIVFQPSVNFSKYKQLVKTLNPTITKVQQWEPGAPEPINQTQNTIELRQRTSQQGVDALYSCDDGKTWQESPLFVGLTPNTAYKCRIKFPETPNHIASSVSDYREIRTSNTGNSNLTIQQQPTAIAGHGTKLRDIPITKGVVQLNNQVIEGRWFWLTDQNLDEELQINNEKGFKVGFVANDASLGSITTVITPTITKRQLETPSNILPLFGGVTKNSITIEPVEAPKGAKTQYKLSTKSGRVLGEWQESNVFTGLSSNTTYIAAVQFVGGEHDLPSAEATIEITTLSENSSNAVYTMIIERNAERITYGETAQYRVKIYADGELIQNEGKVSVYTDDTLSTKLISANVQSGIATLSIPSTSKKINPEQLHRLQFVYETSTKVASNSKISQSVPLFIEAKEVAIQWNNIEGRVENDGKQVTATLSGVLNSDDVQVFVENANAQLAGKQAAIAKRLEGRDAKWYRIGSGRRIDFIIQSTEGPQPPVPPKPEPPTPNPGVEITPVNRVPQIQASNLTLSVGDVFHPLENVSATDAEDGIITLTQSNIISNNVNTQVAGIYQVTYQVQDSKGATVRKTIQVIVNPTVVEPNTPPVITASDVIIFVGDKFDPLANVSASDAEDGEIQLTQQNIVNNTVNVQVAGRYEVTYQVQDSKGVTTIKTIYVIVNERPQLPNTNPIIHANDVMLVVGEIFDPLQGVSATDAEDGPLSVTIISNHVNTNKVGVYEVTYQATDSKGATTIKTIQVVVNPKPTDQNNYPVITAENVVLEVGQTFDPLQGIQVVDKEDGPIQVTLSNIIKNNVDTSRPGVYEVTYQVSDSNGNISIKTIFVTVNEKPDPVNPTPGKPDPSPEKPNPGSGSNASGSSSTSKPNYKPTTGNQTSDMIVSTGDTTNLILWTTTAFIALGISVIMIIKRKSNSM